MNRFVTKEGGQPIFLEDLDFMQKAVGADISNLITSLAGTKNCILSGCEILYNDRITDGFILFNGEILPFPGKLLWDKTGHYLRRVINYPYEGERTLKNGSVVKCYESVSLNLDPSDSATSSIKLLEYDMIEQKYRVVLPRIQDVLNTSRKVGEINSSKASFQVYKRGKDYDIFGTITLSGNESYAVVIDFPSNAGVAVENSTLAVSRDFALASVHYYDGYLRAKMLSADQTGKKVFPFQLTVHCDNE